MTITVITCTFNAATVLERTLQSVLQQQYEGVEHLIIDGCSKDDTLRLAEEYKMLSDKGKNGHTVRIISEPDKGLYDAMNKGLRLATGKYLVYLNAGDTFANTQTLHHVAESAINRAVSEEATATKKLPGVVYGDTDIIDENAQFVRHRRLKPNANLTWRDFRHGMLVCHQAFYALTSIARENPYNTDYRYSADVDWCIRIMKQSEKEGRPLAYCPHVVVHYLEGGISIQNHRASLLERFRVMRTHYGLLPTTLQHIWFAIRAIIRK